MSGANGRRHKNGHLRRWGAAYLMAAPFLASWIAPCATMLIEAATRPARTDWRSSCTRASRIFLASTFETWQSEWLQLIFQAVVLLGSEHLWFRAMRRTPRRCRPACGR